LDIVEHLN
jgi:hypothetical protein